MRLFFALIINTLKKNFIMEYFSSLSVIYTKGN